EHFDLSGRRDEKGRGDPEERRLTGAVAAEQCDSFAPPEREGDASQCLDVGRAPTVVHLAHVDGAERLRGHGPEQADAAYKTRFRSVRFLEAGMLALLEHRKRGLSLGLLLRLAHLDDRGDRPDVAERILQLPVPLAPELVLEWHGGRCTRGEGLVPELVDILRVHVQIERRPPGRVGRFRVATRELVRHHHERVADLDHRVHERAVRHPLAGDLLRAERFLVELDRLRCSVDYKVRRDGSHPRWDRGDPCRGRSLSRGCLLALSCFRCFARYGTPPPRYRPRSDRAAAVTSSASY